LRTLIVIILFMFFISFDEQSHDFSIMISDTYHYVDIDNSMLTYREKVYLPVYPQDYLDMANKNINMVSSVHVENRSAIEPIYILSVNYYNSNGNLADRLIKKTVKIPPGETVQFILNKNLTDGSNGENVIVDWGCVTRCEKPDIYMEMIMNTTKGPVSIKDEGSIISDQNEINDRRPL